MTDISDEMLMAYADDELPPREREGLETRLKVDADLRARLEPFAATGLSLAAFFDLINHRLISLFYRAWEKHHFIVARERGGDEPFARHLFDLIGLGTGSPIDIDPNQNLAFFGEFNCVVDQVYQNLP